MPSAGFSFPCFSQKPLLISQGVSRLEISYLDMNIRFQNKYMDRNLPENARDVK